MQRKKIDTPIKKYITINMTQYDSKTVEINKSRVEIFSKLENMKALEEFKDKIPQEYREKINFGEDFISFELPSFSTNVVLRLVAKNQDSLKFNIEDLPIPAKFQINLSEKSAETTSLSTSISADIPFFMKPMISGKIQPALDKLAETFSKVL